MRTQHMKKIVEFFKGAREELKKVSWPSRKQTVRDTMIVIFGSAVVAVFLGAFDFLFSFLIELAIKK